MGVGTEDQTAFAFDGEWREYLPIAGTNLLLTMATLGIYRFWGTTRERRYLWGKTRFIDDRLEWTGTGKELLIGFLIASVLVGPALLFLNVYFQRMLLNNQAGLAFTILSFIYVLLLYLGGFGRFRALRYRLSRTYWHGIRGGTNDAGFKYGFSYLWKYAIGYLAMGLLVPWSMADLWKERWQAMSFGPLMFKSEPRWSELMKRYLLFYLSPIAALFAGIAMAVPMAIFGSVGSGPTSPVTAALLGVSFVLVFYGVLGVVALAFYAKFFREAVGTLSLGKLEFEFTARTKDWLKFALGSVAVYTIAIGLAFLVLAPFGISEGLRSYFLSGGRSANVLAIIAVGLVAAIPLGFAGAINQFRNWRFFIRHMEAGGEVDLQDLTQSTTSSPTQGEGLLDAFDMGAI
jgi:uncharacterized membrane protein YjgN (DUF898 family)